MKCINCGASIPRNTDICPYCSTHNDRDLKSSDKIALEEPSEARYCVRCPETLLETLRLPVGEGMLVERCPTCLGLFFDVGELEILLDKVVDAGQEVEQERLTEIVEQRAQAHQEIDPIGSGYVRCPVCRKFMNRKQYAIRSGVIVDWCKAHGLWLDAGELYTLMHWRRAGGEIHAENRSAERAYLEEQLKRASASIDDFDPGRGQRGNEGDGFVQLCNLFSTIRKMW